MSDSLDILLKRLRDGRGTPEDLVRARSAVRADARLPEELRAVVFEDPTDVEADAAGVLSVLGLDDSLVPGSQPGERLTLADAVLAEALAAPAVTAPDEEWEVVARALREGLEAEARGFDAAETVMRRLPAADFAHAALVAPAVTAEAGQVDLSSAVLAGLGEALLPVAEAVRDEAGEVDVADAVLAELGLERLPLREALRAEAGKVDVVGGVMAAIGAWRVDEVPVRSVPRPATRWPRIAGLALAAVALISVVVGRLAVPVEDAPEHLVFASATEVHIEELEVAGDVQVAQLEGDGGAVILWLDEEA